MMTLLSLIIKRFWPQQAEIRNGKRLLIITISLILITAILLIFIQ